MKINLAHLRERSTSGEWIDFAVFDAKSNSGDSGNSALLAQLTMKARASGLKVDQSALVYNYGGQIKFYGTKTLVDYLSRMGVPGWTHMIDI